MHSKIVLATFKAGWQHTAVGLRYLKANLGALKDRTCLFEFENRTKVQDAVEAVLAKKPQILGLSCHIWSVSLLADFIKLVRLLSPETVIIAGGPEISFETERSPLFPLVDFVVAGEGEHEFRKLCEALLLGERPAEKIIKCSPLNLETIETPYKEYVDSDLNGRMVYVESSRGCPFRCEFCISSLDEKVRYFELGKFLSELESLYVRGARHFKFIDRTFNTNKERALKILQYFEGKCSSDLLLHFEVVPDRLDPDLMEEMGRFRSGVIQLEAGVQTLNPEVAKRIGRNQDIEKTLSAVCWLRKNTGVHIHADLIAGLPGEGMESFGRSFDRLFSSGPQEIQVGILKRLNGAPISRHTEEWNMVYSPIPPYEVLRTGSISFEDLNRLKRFARYFDLVCNSGGFPRSAPLIWAGGSSVFRAFLQFSDWLHAKIGRTWDISRTALSEKLHIWLCKNGMPEIKISQSLAEDLASSGHREVPEFIRRNAAVPFRPVSQPSRGVRQMKHRAEYPGAGPDKA